MCTSTKLSVTHKSDYSSSIPFYWCNMLTRFKITFIETDDEDKKN